MEKSVEEEKAKTIQNLIDSQVVTIAKRPFANPKELPKGQAFAIFFSEEDYPALSPATWNRVAEEFGFDFALIMLVAKPDDLPEIFAALKSQDSLRGGVFGVGFKDESVQLLDHVEPIVAISNSVNVFLKNPAGELEGFNTDAAGFVRSLREKLTELGRGDLGGKKIVILGAGGTGAAISFLLAKEVGSLVILNRTIEKAVEISKKINHYYGKEIARFGGEDQIAQELDKADIVINTTTKGATGPFANYTALTPAAGEWTAEKNLTESERLLLSLSGKPLICDVILAGRDTPTIALAKKFNLPTLDGRPMNLYQAIPAIKLVFPATSRVSDRELEDTMAAAQIEAARKQ